MKKTLLILIVLLITACSQNKFYIELLRLKENKIKKHNTYKRFFNKNHYNLKKCSEIILYKTSIVSDVNFESTIFYLVYDIKNQDYYLGWFDYNNKSNFKRTQDLNDSILKVNIHLFMKKEFTKLQNNILDKQRQLTAYSTRHEYYYINTDSTSKSYKFIIY